MSPSWCQTIIWTNAGSLLIETLVTHFSRIQIKIQQFSFKGMSFKIPSKNSGHLVLASMCSSLQLFNHFYCLASCIAFCTRQLPIQLILLRSNSEFHKKNSILSFPEDRKITFHQSKKCVDAFCTNMGVSLQVNMLSGRDFSTSSTSKSKMYLFRVIMHNRDFNRESC